MRDGWGSRHYDSPVGSLQIVSLVRVEVLLLYLAEDRMGGLRMERYVGNDAGYPVPSPASTLVFWTRRTTLCDLDLHCLSCV